MMFASCRLLDSNARWLLVVCAGWIGLEGTAASREAGTEVTEYAGHVGSDGYDDIVFCGDVKANQFTAF